MTDNKTTNATVVHSTSDHVHALPDLTSVEADLSEAVTTVGVAFTAEHDRMIRDIHAALTQISATVADLLPMVQNNPMVKAFFGE